MRTVHSCQPAGCRSGKLQQVPHGGQRQEHPDRSGQHKGVPAVLRGSTGEWGEEEVACARCMSGGGWVGGVGVRCTWGWNARMWGGMDGCDCMCPLNKV